MRSFVVGLMLLSAAAPAAAQTKYRVKTSFDKSAPFTVLKTYAWMPGWSAFLWPVDQQIMTAVDREMAQLGFVKVESGRIDVLVTYAAVQRTDVDLKSKLPENRKLRRQYRVGTLIVLLREPSTNRVWFRGRGDTPLASDGEAVAHQIDSMVTQMFEGYPTRTGERR